MERTIYSKYSNERAENFRIRTDIATDESGEKKVYKYALTREAEAHVGHIGEAYQRLTAAYDGSGISFCPAKTQHLDGNGCRSVSPFLTGVALQDVLERMLDGGDIDGIRRLLRVYVTRIKESGGSRPFVLTPEFARVFGEAVPDGVYDSADVSDIDMIFSNIFVKDEPEALTGAWTVIDYEWTFDFPVPKTFVIYRAIYFGWHQVFYKADMSLPELLAFAEITPEQAAVFRRMEERFQAYMGQGSLPVRNMQRLMGTKIVPVKELTGTGEGGAAPAADHSGKLKVRKLLYHVDRAEYQDGSMVCSGWALAKTWDGRALPANIRVTDENGSRLNAEVGRRKRPDVAETLKLRGGADTEWGFDCVWLSQPGEAFRIYFSLGNRESVYEG